MFCPGEQSSLSLSYYCSRILGKNFVIHDLAVTETYLTRDMEDAEIVRHFSMYRLYRGNRDITNGQKQKQGGCLLLNLPDIISMAKELFSNSICGAILTEHPTMDLTVATVCIQTTRHHPR